MANRLETFYAKISFRLDTDKRLGAYRKLASLLRGEFTLLDALDRLYNIESRNGKKPGEPFAIAFRDWMDKLERGYSFPEAVQGWVPEIETLMLSVGDMSKLSIALDNTVRITEGSGKISSALISALAYPLFLLVASVAIVVMVGEFLVPPMLEAVGRDVVWRGAARTLVNVSEFAGANWVAVSTGLAVAAVLAGLSMSRLTGGFRVMLDRFPPWSLYKISSSAGWLVSLASLMRAGATLPEALKIMAGSSNKYLSDVSDKALFGVIAGRNLGDALEQAETKFPNEEIIGDLKIYAELDNFDKNLMNVANGYMDGAVSRIEGLSNMLNSVGILVISVVIAWVVFGTFELQDQVAAAIS
ncbi:MAG: type II secretion system F family protein [Rickettsiales bacterium]|jgi:type II secretory pathway component PulF|nr:type II secretion system F family protein [Rickettsiales bacterium]